MSLLARSPFVVAGSRRNPLSTMQIFYGTAVTRAAVLADVDTNPGEFPAGIGSFYLSQGGHGMYIKLTQSSPPAATDWQKVTSTAAD